MTGKTKVMCDGKIVRSFFGPFSLTKLKSGGHERPKNSFPEVAAIFVTFPVNYIYIKVSCVKR